LVEQGQLAERVKLEFRRDYYLALGRLAWGVKLEFRRDYYLALGQQALEALVIE
jgi:hypothetical protein